MFVVLVNSSSSMSYYVLKSVTQSWTRKIFIHLEKILKFLTPSLVQFSILIPCLIM